MNSLANNRKLWMAAAPLFNWDSVNGGKVLSGRSAAPLYLLCVDSNWNGLVQTGMVRASEEDE